MTTHTTQDVGADYGPVLNEHEMDSGLNMAAAWKAVAGNRQLFRQAVSVILDDCPRLLESLETSAARGDVAGVRRAAHTLASSLRLFGMTSGANLAHQLQKIGTLEGSYTAELLADLRQECHRMQTLLSDELRQRFR